MDVQLIDRAGHGDRDAFGVLARAQANRLYAMAYRVLRDVALAEDAVQTTLVIAWRELPRLRDPERFESWIHQILIRSCYREARHRRDSAGSVRLLAGATTGLDHADSIADRDLVDRGFRRLAPEHRAILVLHHYLGLDPAEIAETLGIPSGTARSRLHYAHQAMRAALEADARPTAAMGGRAR